MWLDVTSGRVPEGSVAVVSARWRRAKFWLTTCVALHLALAAFAVGATVWRYQQGVDGLPDFGSKASGAGVHELAFPAVFAVLSMAVGLWLVRKPQLMRSPDSWIAIPLATGVLMVAGVGGATVHVMSEAAGNVNFVLIPAVIVFAVLPVYLAFRALLRPLVAELGDSTVPVVVQVRAASKKWWYQDSVRVDTESVRLAVRSGDGRPTWGESTKSIPLRDVVAVGARSATGNESPWAWLSDGRGLSVPAGDVLVVATAIEEQLVPVHDAAVLAELVRRRARLVTGRMPAMIDAEAAASENPQQWIVPVLRAELIAEIVRGRAARARPLAYRAPTVEEWHRLRRWSVSATTAARGRGLGTAQAIGNRLLLIAMFPAVFGTLLLANVFGRELTGVGTELLVIAGALFLAVVLVVIWYRRRSALMLAEDNQLPPGSPPWGDQRPDRAPIPAWRPWSASAETLAESEFSRATVS